MTRDAIRRAGGLILVVTFLLAWEPDGSGTLDRLVLPFVAAAGAYLVIGSVLAVALAVAALAGIHSHLGADDWISSRAYPGAAIVAATLAAGIALRRFRARMRETREARARARAARTAETS